LNDLPDTFTAFAPPITPNFKNWALVDETAAIKNRVAKMVDFIKDDFVENVSVLVNDTFFLLKIP
jgi:hypothetical protein